MDACKVPKDIRIRMLDDSVYIAETKAIKAHLFIDQLSELDNVIAGSYDNSEKGSDRSATVLRCLELKQKLLLEDLNVTKDDSNALNVVFTAMTKEDFEALSTIEVHEGGNARELGPAELVRRAVKGMLPKTRLGADLLGNLFVYAGPEHPHQAQNPQVIKLDEI